MISRWMSWLLNKLFNPKIRPYAQSAMRAADIERDKARDLRMQMESPISREARISERILKQ